MERRAFLKRVIKSFFALIVLALTLSVRYMYPVGIRKKTLHFFLLFDEDDLPGAGLKRADFTYDRSGRKIHGKVFVVAAKGGYIALSPVCSHLGCLVNWDTNRGEFLCPCHGGRYGMEGEVIAGPPPGPLTRLPLEVTEGKVYVGIKL